MDNAFYALALGERTKVRVEENGRVVLTETERKSLRNTKLIFLVTVVTLILRVVSHGLSGEWNDACGNVGFAGTGLCHFMLSPFFWIFQYFWAAGIIEVLLDGATVGKPKEKAIDCAKVTCAAFWGQILWFFLWIVSSGKAT